MLRSLVGSEMCIRDRYCPTLIRTCQISLCTSHFLLMMYTSTSCDRKFLASLYTLVPHKLLRRSGSSDQLLHKLVGGCDRTRGSSPPLPSIPGEATGGRGRRGCWMRGSYSYGPMGSVTVVTVGRYGRFRAPQAKNFAILKRFQRKSFDFERVPTPRISQQFTTFHSILIV